MTPTVKICGLSTGLTLDAALDAGADMVGFVFFPKSPRHIDWATARALGRQVQGRAKIVALSVDADDDTLKRIIDALSPDLLQLHGRETPARVNEIGELFARPTMKAIGVATREDLAAAEAYEGVADYAADRRQAAERRRAAGRQRPSVRLAPHAGFSCSSFPGFCPADSTPTASQRRSHRAAPAASTSRQASRARRASRIQPRSGRLSRRRAARSRATPLELSDEQARKAQFLPRRPERARPLRNLWRTLCPRNADAAHSVARKGLRGSEGRSCFQGRTQPPAQALCRAPEPALFRRAADRTPRRREDLLQARGAQPHRRAQDQQRDRPDPARPPHGQKAHHRRDRRRPAWRRHRDRLRALRPRMHRLHGRARRRAAEAERLPHEDAGRGSQGRSSRARRPSRTR